MNEYYDEKLIISNGVITGNVDEIIKAMYNNFDDNPNSYSKIEFFIKNN